MKRGTVLMLGMFATGAAAQDLVPKADSMRGDDGGMVFFFELPASQVGMTEMGILIMECTNETNPLWTLVLSVAPSSQPLTLETNGERLSMSVSDIESKDEVYLLTIDNAPELAARLAAARSFTLEVTPRSISRTPMPCPQRSTSSPWTISSSPWAARG